MTATDQPGPAATTTFDVGCVAQAVETEQASAELVAEVGVAERHLSRTEVKANLLALLYGSVVLGAASAIVSLEPPLPSAVGAWIAVGLFGIACGLLAGAVRPSLKTRSGQHYGIVLYACVEVEQIPAAVTAAHTTRAMSTRLIDASSAAVSKYQWIGRAVDVAWCGAAVLAASAVTAPLFQRFGWPDS